MIVIARAGNDKVDQIKWEVKYEDKEREGKIKGEKHNKSQRV